MDFATFFKETLFFILTNLPSLITIIFAFIVIYLYIDDKSQYKHTIRRNYPVIGRFRYFFEEMGVFFRQYFFALDREELPFNRAERSWIYRSSKNLRNTLAFGSTKQSKEGDVLFANSIFPYNDKEEQKKEKEIIFGNGIKNKYTTKSFFNISGMSYGAISKPAVKALSAGAKLANAWINTGEGGPSQFHLKSEADIVIQIGTAKYGMRNKNGNLSIEKLKNLSQIKNVKMFEIKLSQGAKPGKGGILPAEKVTEEIAKIRGIEQGKKSISPSSHIEIKDNESLSLFIKKIKETTNKPVGIKLCLGSIQEFEDLIKYFNSKRVNTDFLLLIPDFITIDSGSGGTGAAPMTHLDATGLNIQQSLPISRNIINKYSLEKEIKIIASGKLVTPVEVAWALCAGADVVVSARGFMFALGCIQSLQCNKNTCPTGIATHNKKLQKGLDPKLKTIRVANYILNLRKEVDSIANSCGVSSGNDLSRKNALIFTSNNNAEPMEDMYK